MVGEMGEELRELLSGGAQVVKAGRLPPVLEHGPQAGGEKEEDNGGENLRVLEHGDPAATEEAAEEKQCLWMWDKQEEEM